MESERLLGLMKTAWLRRAKTSVTVDQGLGATAGLSFEGGNLLTGFLLGSNVGW
jgi:hypothetical protein